MILGLFLFVVLVFCLGLMYLSVIYVLPVTNRLFSLIWEDPTERQRKKILKRIKELYVDGNIPEETAILMAAKEYNTTEREVLETIGAVSVGDVVKMATGKMSPLGYFFDGLERNFKKGTGR